MMLLNGCIEIFLIKCELCYFDIYFVVKCKFKYNFDLF